MALQGNLSNFRLGDLLQTLTQNQTWGVLRLESSRGRRDLVVSPFGVAILDLQSVARARLEERLLHKGALDHGAFQSLRSRENRRRPLGEILEEIPNFPWGVFEAALDMEAAEHLESLLEWAEGQFEVVEGEATAMPSAETRPRETAALLLETARRMDERAQLGPRYPDPEERFVPVPQASSAPTPDEAALLASLDGAASARATADRASGDFFATAKALLDLESRGLARRLEWAEYLDLAERLGNGGDLEAADQIFHYLETWDSGSDETPLVDMAKRRHSLGDLEGAARCYAKAAEILLNANKASLAADCLSQAVALAPRESTHRERRVEAVRRLEPKNPRLQYECLRDWLVTRSDRGESSGVEDLEREILTLMPSDPDEEARVGRALGQLGRKATAAQLLCRAAKRRLGVRGAEESAASEFQEALRLVADFPEARKGLARVEGRRKGRRRATVVLLSGVAGLTLAVAIPLRFAALDRAELASIAEVESLASRGDLDGARKLLDRVEPSLSHPEALKRGQAMRESLARALDEHRQRENADSDPWVRERFTGAADAIDARDYGRASVLYEEILSQNGSEESRARIRQRLQMIARKVTAELRRVQDAIQIVATKNKSAKRQALEHSETALRDLESLVAAPRRAGLATFEERLAHSPLGDVLEADETSELRKTLARAIETFAKGDTIRETIQGRIDEDRELVELEQVLVEARAAEEKGDARGALARFETLSSRYKGAGLRPYLNERTQFWRGVAAGLDAYEKALAAGDAASAARELARARSACPALVVKDSWVSIEVRVAPAYASLLVEGMSIPPGERVRVRTDRPTRFEASAPGHERMEGSIEPGAASPYSIQLVPLPLWSRDLAATPSGSGMVSEGFWVIADRQGTIRAVRIADGEVAWSKQVKSIGGFLGNPCRVDSSVVGVTVEGRVQAYDLQSGRELWSLSLPTRAESAPVESAGSVAILGEGHVAYVLTPGTSAPAVHTQRLGAGASTTLVTAPSGFAIGSTDGTVTKLTIAGEVEWRTLGGSSIEWLAILADGPWLAATASEVHRLDPLSGARLASAPHTFASAVLADRAPAGDLLLAVGNELKDLVPDRLDVRGTTALPVKSIRGLVRAPRHLAVTTSESVLATDSQRNALWQRGGLAKPSAILLSPDVIGIVEERGALLAVPFQP